MENTETSAPVPAEQTAAEEIEKKKKSWLEMLIELLDKLRKPYYSAIKEIEKNLDTLSQTNVLTAHLLDNLISTTGELNGKLRGDESPEEIQSVIDELQQRIESMKGEVASIESISAILQEGDSNFSLFEKDDSLFLFDNTPDSDRAFKVILSKDEASGKPVILTEELNISSEERMLYTPVEMSEHAAENRNDAIMGEILSRTLSLEEIDKLSLMQKNIEEMNRSIQEQQRTTYIKGELRKYLETDNGRFVTRIDDNDRFTIADREQQVILVFNQDNGTLRADCYKCNSDMKPEGERLIVASTWRNNDNDTISYTRTFDSRYVFNEMFRIPATKIFLGSKGLSNQHIATLGIEEVTPNASVEKTTEYGSLRIDAIFKGIRDSDIICANNISVEKQTIEGNGNFIRMTTKGGNMTQINFDKDGNAVNIEYRSASDNKGFVRTHRIMGGMVTREMQTPPDCQFCMDIYSGVIKNINERNRRIQQGISGIGQNVPAPEFVPPVPSSESVPAVQDELRVKPIMLEKPPSQEPVVYTDELPFRYPSLSEPERMDNTAAQAVGNPNQTQEQWQEGVLKRISPKRPALTKPEIPSDAPNPPSPTSGQTGHKNIKSTERE